MSSRFGACVGITRVAVVFVRGVSVGLGFVWGKFQSLGFFGLLRVAVVFFGVGLGFNLVLVSGVFVFSCASWGLFRLEKQKCTTKKKKQNSGEAEKQISIKAAVKSRKAEKPKAKKQKSKEDGKGRNPKKNDQNGTKIIIPPKKASIINC